MGLDRSFLGQGRKLRVYLDDLNVSSMTQEVGEWAERGPVERLRVAGREHLESP